MTTPDTILAGYSKGIRTSKTRCAVKQRAAFRYMSWMTEDVPLEAVAESTTAELPIAWLLMS